MLAVGTANVGSSWPQFSEVFSGSSFIWRVEPVPVATVGAVVSGLPCEAASNEVVGATEISAAHLSSVVTLRERCVAVELLDWLSVDSSE
jgi:hypothetical protein